MNGQHQAETDINDVVIGMAFFTSKNAFTRLTVI
jgi:hypothetical protein